MIKLASQYIPQGNELEVTFNDTKVIEYFKNNPINGVTVRTDRGKSQSKGHGTHLHFQFKK
ncbi:Hypothetical protein LEPBI_II0223 [Leptospira biflexa serovar Patoc strain 'Patoc 1 (Paris)']|uniref:Uncharacterized protein n=1 Tax=Leptospira biflexa serovar Patoc (strain Patoc 1 / ATCC 23582 / Paris) TaxID=456481 RepID=B0SU72_LEPBP|nr:Hypothetical protein LEPBI_II0223 [Leptospira biflexa serovar Patoc strain 'Patoc 1 (Paris)']